MRSSKRIKSANNNHIRPVSLRKKMAERTAGRKLVR